jgi:hypothetical protein
LYYLLAFLRLFEWQAGKRLNKKIVHFYECSNTAQNSTSNYSARFYDFLQREKIEIYTSVKNQSAI